MSSLCHNCSSSLKYVDEKTQTTSCVLSSNNTETDRQSSLRFCVMCKQKIDDAQIHSKHFFSAVEANGFLYQKQTVDA